MATTFFPRPRYFPATPGRRKKMSHRSVRSRTKEFKAFTLVELPAVSKSKRAAFTLVELLVVIGIIALLIAMLLPALNKAREGARSVACLSNMKQIATATIMYANDNKSQMPNIANWLCWSRKVDPITGISNPSAADQNISMSSLTPYLGAKQVDHVATNQDANRVNEKLENVYRCPSDNLNSRGKFSDNP